MAIGKASDMVIYQAEFQSGMVEKVAQFLAAFNAGSKGAIRLVPRALKGHYGKEAFWADVSTLVSARDITSVAAVTDLAFTQSENISVKINRKIGPIAQTFDALKKAGLSVADASRAFGVMAAERKLKDMLNTGLIAVEAAIEGNTAMNYDASALSANKTASRVHLNTTLQLMGDARPDIVCWVSHSKPHGDVLAEMLTSDVTGLEDIVSIQGAVPAFLGRPVVITDAPALTDANASNTDTYNVLGLVEGALSIEESEEESFITEPVTGLANLAQRFQAEYAYNISVKGFKWDVTNGGSSPSDSTLGTTSNWDQVATSDKHTAGVRLKCE